MISFLGLLSSVAVVFLSEINAELLRFFERYLHIFKAEFYIYPIATLIIVFLFTLAFSSINITIDSKTLHWHFGPGIWHKKISLSEIKAIQAVRNRWWYGFGIRHCNGFWLYCVSGLDAVEITLKSGKIFRLGTDEPTKLVKSIKKSLAKLQTSKGAHFG